MDLYYHTSNQEKRPMFPIDPNLTETRTETSSQSSTRRDDFCGDVEDRDGSCVLTGNPELDHAVRRASEAAHLLPHSKGDKVWDARTTLSLLTILSAVYREVHITPASRPK